MLQLDIPVVVVIRHYLGSINHSMLSLDMLKMRGLKIEAIVFNGPEHESSEAFILKNIDPLIPILRMPELDWNQENRVNEIASIWRDKILK
jgi:dethiobiotin synthetase